MFNIPMRSTGPLDHQTILSLNQTRVQKPLTLQTLNTLDAAPSPAPTAVPAQPSPVRPTPHLTNMIKKGQKIPLKATGRLSQINACLGWDTTNAACDMDVSAFLLDSTGKVPGDDWFVFYGQTHSPDQSIVFLMDQGADRECISVDLTRLDRSVTKIVFVLTIDEALKKRLNFSMIKDAYIRLIDPSSGRTLASFMMDEYYANVTSMMIGEIYQHNGTWKFNAIGNGVTRDLAGLCALYGVQVQ